MKPAALKLQRREGPGEGWRFVGICGLALACVVVCYMPVFRAGWIWDDDYYIWNNPTLRTFSGLLSIWCEPLSTPQYYPLVHTTYWLEYRLWGAWPVSYHAVNVVLHAASSLVLWRVLARLGVPAAGLGAALFAVHPVGVESVAWATERKNTLSMLLALGSLAFWLRHRQAAPVSPGPGGWYWLSLACFGAALLSKTVTVTLIGAILVIEWWRHGRVSAKDIREILPFVLLGLPLAAFTVWLEKNHVGASGTEWHLAPAERILVAGRAICFYFGKLIWPDPLVFFYPRWRLDEKNPLQWLFPIGVLVALAVLWQFQRRVGGPMGRGPLAVMLLFCGLLFPALGFFDVYPFRYSFVADHFQYHASAAMLAGVAAFVGVLAERMRWGRAFAFATVPLLLGLGILTSLYSRKFHDEETLYRDVLAKNPAAWAARNNLGRFLSDSGRLEESEAVYRELLARDDLPPWPHDLATFHHNVGVTLERQRAFEEAESEYRQAIRIDPRYAKPRNNLAKLLADTDRHSEAVEVYRELLDLDRDLKLDPRSRSKHLLNLGTVYAEQARWPDAEKVFRDATRLDPGNAFAWEWLGIAVVRQGRWYESQEFFESAIRSTRDPAAARRMLENMAAALEAGGRAQEATRIRGRAAALPANH